MKKVTNKEMINKIICKQEFVANSAHGVFEYGEYKIYSYSTLIYSSGNGKEYFNNNSYSVTTSKLQNIIIKAYALNFPTKR